MSYATGCRYLILPGKMHVLGNGETSTASERPAVSRELGRLLFHPPLLACTGLWALPAPLLPPPGANEMQGGVCRPDEVACNFCCCCFEYVFL